MKGQIEQSGGGVGRNIADAMGKLHVPPRFVSAVGSDQPGNYLLSQTLKNVVSKMYGKKTYCIIKHFFTMVVLFIV